MEQLTNKIVVTRKEHYCWGCARKFPSKSRLRYTVIVDSGDFSALYWCGVCDEVYSSWDMWMQEDGIGFGDIRDSDPDVWNETMTRLVEGVNEKESGLTIIPLGRFVNND